MFPIVLNPNCERLTSAEAFFVAILQMAAIYDTQMIYMICTMIQSERSLCKFIYCFHYKKKT